MKKGFFRFLGLALVPVFLLFQKADSAIHIGDVAAFVPGEVIVQLKKSATSRAAAEIFENTLGRSVLSVSSFQTSKELFKVKVKKSLTVMDAVEELKKNPNVLYADPNYYYKALSVPNDSFFDKLWGLVNTGQKDCRDQEGIAGADIAVESLWSQGHTGSKDILVAVIDTGVDWDHPDLAGNLYTNPGEAGELSENGIDDDGNGFIDDTHGWNFYANDRNSDDDHNHGTHCAGTIGAVANNSEGVAGVVWNVSILPVKFLSSGGSGTLEAAVESINYATLMGVDIMSNSWGGGGFTAIMEDSIKKARDAGISFIAAAGNDGASNDSRPHYPSNYQVENVIAVAASDNRDGLAYFSNYGDTVHVAAPGVHVWSTVKDGGYDCYSGTSMATPHVAGAVAMLFSIFPDMDPVEVKDRLITTSDRTPALRRKVLSKGRINLDNAFRNFIPPNDDPDESLWKDESFEAESVHPYTNDRAYEFDVNFPGAKYIRIHFEKIQTEAGYDFVKVLDQNGIEIEKVSGTHEGYMSDYILGDSAKIILETDASVTDWGFKANKIQVIMEDSLR